MFILDLRDDWLHPAIHPSSSDAGDVEYNRGTANYMETVVKLEANTVSIITIAAIIPDAGHHHSDHMKYDAVG